tara:strand:- start:345 stop:569 length:225 start_codon:yes stop_codon:yes gene_type:complete
MITKFKPYQRIIVPNFLINSSRLDISGTIQRYIFNRETKKWKVECVINGTFVLLDEDRIIDYDEYHANKKKEEK